MKLKIYSNFSSVESYIKIDFRGNILDDIPHTMGIRQNTKKNFYLVRPIRRRITANDSSQR